MQGPVSLAQHPLPYRYTAYSRSYLGEHEISRDLQSVDPIVKTAAPVHIPLDKHGWYKHFRILTRIHVGRKGSLPGCAVVQQTLSANDRVWNVWRVMVRGILEVQVLSVPADWVLPDDLVEEVASLSETGQYNGRI
jgi:hypothetical protein